MKRILLLLVVVVVSGCSFKTDITYKVTGTADRASVTYTNSSGGTSQETSVEIPWKHKMEVGIDSGAISIVSQNKGRSGSIMVEIKRNGGTLEVGRATGAYGVASASAYID